MMRPVGIEGQNNCPAGQWLCRPAAMVILLLLAVLDLSIVVVFFGNRSDVGAWVRVRFFDRPQFVPRANARQVVFVRDAQGYRVVASDLNGAPIPSPIPGVDPDSLIGVSYFDNAWQEGFWAPTTRREQRSLAVMQRGGQVLDGAMVLQLRLACAQHAENLGKPEMAANLLADDVDSSSVIWWGLAYDAATLVLGGALFLSLASVPIAWRRRRAAELLTMGVCPGCGYDLTRAELVGGIKCCPECGEMWSYEGLFATDY